MVVTRRTRPSLRAAANVLAFLPALLLLPMAIPSICYVFCRASGCSHERAWWLSIGPEVLITSGDASNRLVFLQFTLAASLLGAAAVQVRFGSRAFRPVAIGSVLTITICLLAELVLGWFLDQRTWSGLWGGDQYGNYKPHVVFGAALVATLAAILWWRFRHREQAIIADLRAKPGDPDRLRAP